MGAFIFAGVVFAIALALAVLSELARGMAPAPSMVRSSFAAILVPGAAISVLIALTHWLPHIGW